MTSNETSVCINDGTNDAANPLQSPQLIQPIPKQAIQRIVAGQAITDLSSAVKELVDNAIDAGARRVTIKLFDRGLEAIEVSDNGHGVPPSSRPYMAMKHATSKLRRFDDLYSNIGSDQSNSGRDNSTIILDEDCNCAPTLGFRGEALFCLANISRSLTVVTRSSEDETKDADGSGSSRLSKLGEQFEFDSDGHIISTSIKRVPLSQPTGTTVTVRGLFERLPVRRVDMIKRIKLQRMKLIKMMQGYAILCLGTQFNITDIAGSSTNNKSSSKQKIETRLATSESSKTLESRVSSILGTKFLSGLTRMDIDLSAAVRTSFASTTNTRSSNSNNNNNNNFDSRQWRVEGLISYSPAYPHPENARELQFFGINGRPVDLPSISRLLSDIWRLFDPSSVEGESNTRYRRPACILSFTLPNHMYDVNLSPDKREVMFTEEAMISDLIREGLMELWSSQSEGKFEANEVECRSNKYVKGSKHDAVQECLLVEKDKEDKKFESDEVTPKFCRKNTDNEPIVTPADVEDPVQHELDKSSNNDGPITTCVNTSTPVSLSRDNIFGDDTNWTQMQLPKRARTQDRRNWNQAQIDFQRIQKVEDRLEVNRILSPVHENDKVGKSWNEVNRPASSIVLSQSLSPTEPQDDRRATAVRATTRQQSKRLKRDFTSSLRSFTYGSVDRADLPDDYDSHDSGAGDDSLQEEKSITDMIDSKKMVHGRIATKMKLLPRSIKQHTRGEETMAEDLNNHDNDEITKSNRSQSSPSVIWSSFNGTENVIAQSQHARLLMRKARSQILSSAKRKREEKINANTDEDYQETDREETIDLCKDDFLRMDIIGQFNLGFILARCRKHNLWILDQHACDEKYNFERLCKETVIHEQTLIAPLPLDLSPSEEYCVLEHMDDFERNGFRFSYDPEKEPRHRLSLTALPHSGSGGDGKKAVQFGREDVGALCAILGADGTSSSEGYNAGFGSGASGGRIAGVNAVRRYAGLAGGGQSQEGGKLDGIVGSTIVRLPKAIAMFASRACRGSVMIGTALSEKEQLNILKKLDKCDVPWNCAHGRPTMSHIRNLIKCLIDDDDAIASHLARPTLSIVSEE